MNIKVSIVIVYFDQIDNLLNALQAIYTFYPKYEYEILVVDNGIENIKEVINAKYPLVRYFKSDKNLGYGAGNNFGITKSRGEYIFILNPDTFVQKGTLDTLVSFLDTHKRAAVVAPNLLHTNMKEYTLQGSLVLTPIRAMFSHTIIHTALPNNPIAYKYFLFDQVSENIQKADCVPGCAVLLRKTAFYDVGMYDEKLFLYYEESDLGKRLKESGWESYILKSVSVIHNHGYDNNPVLKKYNAESRFYYFTKHYGLLSATFVELFARLSKRIIIGVFVFISILIILLNVV